MNKEVRENPGGSAEGRAAKTGRSPGRQRLAGLGWQYSGPSPVGIRVPPAESYIRRFATRGILSGNEKLRPLAALFMTDRFLERSGRFRHGSCL